MSAFTNTELALSTVLSDIFPDFVFCSPEKTLCAGDARESTAPNESCMYV